VSEVAVIKIIHLTTAHSPNDVRIYEKMCKSIALSGAEVHLVAPRSGCEVDRISESVHMHYVDASKSRMERFLKRGRDVVRVASRLRGDLYHMHDPELLLYVKYLKRNTAAKIVFDAHEDIRAQILHKEWLPRIARKAVSYIYGMIEERALARLDGMIAATPAIAERYSDTVTCETIQNYPILGELDGCDRDVDKEYFVYIGVLTKERGIDTLAEAVNNEGGVCRLLLAGRWAMQESPDMRSSHDDWKYVRYIGQRQRRELPQILRRAYAGMVLFKPLPNHTRSQPNKLFEYMSAGLPVIASDFPMWRDIIEKEKCGLLVNPNDPRAIGDAMTWFLENGEEAEEMGRRGKAAVYRKYSWASESKKMLEYYNVILNG
jgi:glycosyltransferase involved in cell wall biosynthesis